MNKKYILSLKLPTADFNRLTELRTRYFPEERNFLSAHITLFHALPEEERSIWERDLTQLSQTVFSVQIGAVYSLGRGVALRVESIELAQLRKRLALGWSSFLSPQDLQGYRPHCTLQNKVDPEVAKSTLAEVQGFWQPFESSALGLSLYEYFGGPWRKERVFEFKS